MEMIGVGWGVELYDSLFSKALLMFSLDPPLDLDKNCNIVP